MALTPELLVAILNFSVRFGIPAAKAVMDGIKNKGATIDDAIAALDAAGAKSLADYKAEDLAARATA